MPDEQEYSQIHYSHEYHENECGLSGAAHAAGNIYSVEKYGGNISHKQIDLTGKMVSAICT